MQICPTKLFWRLPRLHKKRKKRFEGSCSVEYQPVKKFKPSLVNDSENSDCMVNNVKEKCSWPIFSFNPLDKNTQMDLSILVDLPLKNYVLLFHDTGSLLQKPSKVKKCLLHEHSLL